MGNQGGHDLVGYDYQRRQLYTLQHPSTRSEAKQSGVSSLHLRYVHCTVRQLLPTNNRSKPQKNRTGFNHVLQLLAVFLHSLTIYPLIPIFLLTAYAIFNPLRVILPVLLSLVLPRSFTQRSEFLRSLPIWRLFASYFPIRLYRSTTLPPTGKYIFGYHPHGILSHGAFGAFATEALGFSELFPGIENSLLTLDSNFRIPIYRDYLLLLGMGSVSRASCEKILNTGGIDGKGTGNGITIVIGGAKESLEAVPNTMRLVLKDRKGFAKLAIRNGASLVPVLSFGENDLYTMLSDLNPKSFSWRVQQLFKKVLGFTVPFFYSKGPHMFDFGITPHRRPVNIVVGRPIHTQKMVDPVDQAYLDEVHGLYVQELERMWDEWKDVFALGRAEEITFI